MNKKSNRIIRIIILIVIIFLIYEIIEIMNTDKDIMDEVKYNNVIEDNNIIENNVNIAVNNTEKRVSKKVINEYMGYKVVAQLEIKSINLDTYVLENDINALNKSPIHFWGVNANNIGNCCIAGHNFNKKNMFKNLYKVKIGDEIILSDNENGTVSYKVYDKDVVLPEETQCVSQYTKGKREITLVTCTNDSSHRIIIKAKES